MWAAMGADQDARPGAMQDGVNVSGYTKPFAGYDGSNSIDDYAWYNDDDRLTTQPVGTKNANELGLHDMSGNVSEWNWDWEDDYPTGDLTDYRGADDKLNRVVRGGYWGDDPPCPECEVATRSDTRPKTRIDGFGFRLVRP